MTKKILVLHTETTGLHENESESVSKKNLYTFARLVKLSYHINTYDGNFENVVPTISRIIKPHTININNSTKYHNITQDDAIANGIDIYTVLNEFISHLKICHVIVSHNINFHLKTILAEAVRFNIVIDVSKYTIIDTNTFFHNYDINTKEFSQGNITLDGLAKKLKIKITTDKLELINLVFTKLYKQYEDYVKKS